MEISPRKILKFKIRQLIRNDWSLLFLRFGVSVSLSQLSGRMGFRMHSQSKFCELSNQESKRLTEDEEESHSVSYSKRRFSYICILHVIIFLLCLSVAMSGWMRHPATPTDLDCATQLSPYC